MMELTAKQAQVLLDQYRTDLEATNEAVQLAQGITTLYGHQYDSYATLRMQLIPLIISALEAVANDNASLFAPVLPAKADLTTEDKDKLAFHAESFGTSPDARAFLKLIFITPPNSPAEDHQQVLLVMTIVFAPSRTENIQSLKQSIIDAEKASIAEMAEAEERVLITSILDEIIEEATKETDKPAPQKTNSEPTFNNTTFTLNCLSGLAILAGGILVVAAMIALKPLLVIGGLALAAIGAMSLVKTSEHGLFSQTEKADDSTANTSTASNTAAL
ncbi:MAG: hypothetical protein K0U37_09190 [Gammaproteobacteria bacterium]|nr:hypothetical protein [Gammaproteobacteria bacterium]